MFIPPRRTGPHVSLLYPMSLSGLFMVACLGAFLVLMRFTAWLLTETMQGIATAGVVIFNLLALAYAARCLLVAAEASAEGYDLPPSPPDPREAELVFGAAVKLVAALFFCLLPLVISEVTGLDLGPVPYLLVGAAGLYLPMAIIGMAVTGEITGSFPVAVIGAIACSFVRYLFAALLAAAAGWLIYLGWDGLLARAAMPVKVGLDLAASFLLLQAIHRVGVVYRESTIMKSIIKRPDPVTIDFSSSMPSRPMTEIERVLAERSKQGSDRTPQP